MKERMEKKYYIALLIPILVLCSILLYRYAVAKRYKWIVIHHTASDYGDYDAVKRYHVKQRGMRDAAYHLMLSNGSTKVTAGFLEATNRYRFLSYSLATRSPKYNIWGLHLCVVGNYENKPLPENLRAALGFSIASLQEKFNIPDTHILFHRDVGQTLCPGKYITKQAVHTWSSANGECPTRIKKQQLSVISNARFSIHTVPYEYILVVLVFSVFIILIFMACYKWVKPDKSKFPQKE